MDRHLFDGCGPASCHCRGPAARGGQPCRNRPVSTAGGNPCRSLRRGPVGGDRSRPRFCARAAAADDLRVAHALRGGAAAGRGRGDATHAGRLVARASAGRGEPSRERALRGGGAPVAAARISASSLADHPAGVGCGRGLEGSAADSRALCRDTQGRDAGSAVVAGSHRRADGDAASSHPAGARSFADDNATATQAPRRCARYIGAEGARRSGAARGNRSAGRVRARRRSLEGGARHGGRGAHRGPRVPISRTANA